MSKSRFSLPLFALLVLSAPLSAIGQTFVQDAERHAVANSGLFSTNFAWSDYDLDGDLDLYVTNWDRVYSIPANALFSNNGDSTFTDVAAQAGVANTYNSVAAAWGDYDSDGDPDLYVADFFEQDFLYENDSGSFTEIGRSRLLSNLEKRGSVTSVAWGDYDNDGFLDYYLGKFYFDNELYHNGGDGTLEPILDLGVNDRRDTNGFSWVDYDNDGDLDLYLATGADEAKQPDVLFANDGDGAFGDATAAAGLPPGTTAHLSGGWGDFDGDGAPDLYMTDGWGEGNRLYQNQTPDALFIKVAVRGLGPDQGGINLSGIGVQIKLFDAVNDSLVAYRQVLPGSGPAEVIFGAPGGPYNVEVRFPGNTVPGIRENVRGGQHITLEEPR